MTFFLGFGYAEVGNSLCGSMRRGSKEIEGGEGLEPSEVKRRLAKWVGQVIWAPRAVALLEEAASHIEIDSPS
jgi:hypothetical protein